LITVSGELLSVSNATSDIDMTLAQEVAHTIGHTYPVAVTLYGGYLVDSLGNRTFFPPAHVEAERRNDVGRVTRLDARYTDGSRLRFTWHPQRGPRYAPM
jgi:hypothetical protein